MKKPKDFPFAPEVRFKIDTCLAIVIHRSMEIPHKNCNIILNTCVCMYSVLQVFTVKLRFLSPHSHLAQTGQRTHWHQPAAGLGSRLHMLALNRTLKRFISIT